MRRAVTVATELPQPVPHAPLTGSRQTATPRRDARGRTRGLRQVVLVSTVLVVFVQYDGTILAPGDTPSVEPGISVTGASVNEIMSFRWTAS
eukprot:747523-Hanusia_phi.AAC.1